MLNKPKFLKPSINIQGKNVIDLSLNSEDKLKVANIPFSCIVDGNDVVTAWRIIICRLGDNFCVFDSGKQDTYFEPIDNHNRNVTFKINLAEYYNDDYLIKDEDTDNILLLNSSEAYYWKIFFWDSSDNTTESHEEIFYANSKPTILIKYSEDGKEYHNLVDGQILNRRSYFFKADYAQSEDIKLKRYGWRITDTINNKVILDTITKNQIYGLSGNMSCEYEGFITNFEYSLELYIETQNGFSEIISTTNFNILYTTKLLFTDFAIEPINRSSGIMLDWGNLKTTEGVNKGTSVEVLSNYPVVDYNNTGKPGTNSLVLPDDSEVVFEGNFNADLNISENSYIIISTQLLKNKDCVLLEMNGVDEYSYGIKSELKYEADIKTFTYIIEKEDGEYTSTSYILNNIPSGTVWYIITLYPLSEDGLIKVKEITSANALYPNNELYPSDDLYPYNGEWLDYKGGI